MRSGDNLVKIFAGCFRLLAKLNAGIKDGFFIDLIDGSSRKLLAEYITFLKGNGDSVAQNDILQHRDVAQYHLALISQIQNTLELLEIIKHFKLTDQITLLLLERELLKLELLLLNCGKPFSTSGTKAGGNLDNRQKNKNPKKPAKPQELGMAHKKIAEFIRSKERVQNVEVFGQFVDITRRTLKRKLSELIAAKAIKRISKGKKVFYSFSSVQPNQTPANAEETKQ